jgi:hypothetical protein
MRTNEKRGINLEGCDFGGKLIGARESVIIVCGQSPWDHYLELDTSNSQNNDPLGPCQHS